MGVTVAVVLKGSCNDEGGEKMAVWPGCMEDGESDEDGGTEVGGKRESSMVRLRDPSYTRERRGKLEGERRKKEEVVVIKATVKMQCREEVRECEVAGLGEKECERIGRRPPDTRQSYKKTRRRSWHIYPYLCHPMQIRKHA